MQKVLVLEWELAVVAVDGQAMKAYAKQRVPEHFAAASNPFGDLGCFDN